jgi:methylthioribose-1-phosphate isomerase
MASRTLTLALAADIDGLKKGLDDADKVVKKSSDQIIDFGKKAAAAFAVVGAAATAFAISAIKNAAADEAAQRKLEEKQRREKEKQLTAEQLKNKVAASRKFLKDNGYTVTKTKVIPEVKPK